MTVMVLLLPTLFIHSQRNLHTTESARSAASSRVFAWQFPAETHRRRSGSVLADSLTHWAVLRGFLAGADSDISDLNPQRSQYWTGAMHRSRADVECECLRPTRRCCGCP